jgi:ABC-type lipoprotein release transport system permease subunit
LACMRSSRSVVVGLESGHAADLWMAAGLPTVVAGIAYWIPSKRATRTDPISALRQD